MEYLENEDKIEETVNKKVLDKDEMVLKNVGLVYSIVSSFVNSTSYGLDREELIGVGMMGLCKAIDKFSENRNTKFSTYAYTCIKNEVLFHLRKENKYNRNHISMNTPISMDKKGNSIEIEDTIADASSSYIAEEILLSEDKTKLEEALNHLEETERYIICNRFGLYNKKIMTQNEIARKINMSQASISKAEKSIIAKIEKYFRSKRYL